MPPKRRKTSGRRSSSAEPQSAQPSHINRKAVINYGLVFILGGVMVAVVVAASPNLITGRTQATALPIINTSQPNTLGELLALHPDELEKVDIARMNLLCAEGLPGSENLDLDKCLTRIEEWAGRARREIDRHLYKYQKNPAEFDNSEGQYRMMMLTTVIKKDCGVKYNLERVQNIDFRNSQDLFIHGMIDNDNGGTCVSMPVLIAAVAQRLGYPVKLVRTKAHLFCRWDDGKGDRFNIEVSNPAGMTVNSDEDYRTGQFQLTDREIADNDYLQSLSPNEALAVFLAARGHCIQDNGNLPDAQIVYAQAHALYPKSRLMYMFLADAVLNEYRQSARLAVRKPQNPFKPPRARDVDVDADLRRMEAINAYNRRLMEQATTPPQIPQPVNPGRPGFGGF